MTMAEDIQTTAEITVEIGDSIDRVQRATEENVERVTTLYQESIAIQKQLEEIRKADEQNDERAGQVADSVEKTASEVRKLYLAEDWEGLKKYIKYPVNVGGVVAEDEAAYDKAVKGKKVCAEDRKDMEAETCKDMFGNSHGLCFGSGQIWMQDSSALTDHVPEIHIITISGID